MLNIFPIQFLAPLAYAILRVCIGFIFINLGKKHLEHRHELKQVFALSFSSYGLFFVLCMGITEIIIGTLFVLGLFTQIAAILGMLHSLTLLFFHEHLAHPLIPQGAYLTLILFVSFSLFITGAGILAIDLPI